MAYENIGGRYSLLNKIDPVFNAHAQNGTVTPEMYCNVLQRVSDKVNSYSRDNAAEGITPSEFYFDMDACKKVSKPAAPR